LRAQSVNLDAERLASEVDEVLIGEVGIHARMIQRKQIPADPKR
jgi:hypothetical protein